MITRVKVLDPNPRIILELAELFDKKEKQLFASNGEYIANLSPEELKKFIPKLVEIAKENSEYFSFSDLKIKTPDDIDVVAKENKIYIMRKSSENEDPIVEISIEK